MSTAESETTASDTDVPETPVLDRTVPTTMRAVVHDRYGAPEVLAVEEVAVPTPGTGQVLVRVHAAGLNPLDDHLMRGTPLLVRPTAGWRTPRSGRPGVDLAGVVAAVGSGVDSHRVGDRVYGVGRATVAEYALADADRLHRTPEHLDDDEAGGVGVAAVTALQALRDHGAVAAGDRVLVNGASGGVGTFAVQLAVAMGAEVTAVCSARNADLVRSLGAARVIDYGRQPYDRVPASHDVVVDNVGSVPFRRARRVLADGARFVIVSGPKGRVLGPIPFVARAFVGAIGRDVTARVFVADENPTDLGILHDHLVERRIRPVVDRAVPLTDVADAMTHLATGRARGKVIVRPQQ